MQQLSAQDASFYYQESPETPMHVGSVAILDPSTSPYGPLDLETLTSFYASRLHLMPMARRRLVHVPFNADHPYWIEDEHFDLEFHLHELAMPEPADWQRFYRLCSRILSRPLDLERPPWEVYLIHNLRGLEGLPQHAVALITKMHHAAVDGRSGTDMAIAMADLSPEMATTTPSETWQGERVPTEPELMARTAVGNLLRPAHAAQMLAESFGSGQRLSALMRSNLPSQQTQIPATRFNRRITGHRAIGFERFLLDEVRAMKNAVAGATVNDVALAICGGALRSYLQDKNELPPDPLMAMAPINTRKEGQSYQMGNQVAAMFVPIGTHIEDPVERLNTVRDATRGAKEITNAVGAELMTRYGDFVPAALFNMAQRLTVEYSRANRMAPAFNCSITNVPGPQVPLYMMGCRLVTTLGYGPVTHNMGLIIPIGSYCGEFTISFTACREMVPDAPFFQRCIRDSFSAMRRSVLGRNAKAKIDAVSRDYARMAEEAAAQIQQTTAPDVPATTTDARASAPRTEGA